MTSATPLLPDRAFRPPRADVLWDAGWRLRRAWPRATDHLLLDLLDPDGRPVAGQWWADPRRAEHVAEATPGARDIGPLVLQPDGVDRRLPHLAAWADDPAYHLIGHRPERRAVLAGDGHFVKVLRPQRREAAYRRARLAERLGVGAPAVLDDVPLPGGAPAAGPPSTLVTRALPGDTLTACLVLPDALEVARRVGAAIARLHALPAPPANDLLAVHGPREEQEVVLRWGRLAAAHGAAPVPDRVPELPTPSRWTLVHRDLHDGQLLLEGDAVGMLDFDLLALGDPALDLANLLAHLELRAQQGLPVDPAATAEAVLEGYRPDPAVRTALPAYLEAARSRLRAVYAFRDPELST